MVAGEEGLVGLVEERHAPLDSKNRVSRTKQQGLQDLHPSQTSGEGLVGLVENRDTSLHGTPRLLANDLKCTESCGSENPRGAEGLARLVEEQDASPHSKH